MRTLNLTLPGAVGVVDSAYAWVRLLAGVLISTIGGVGMWSIAVVLPTLQADFGVTRADVSLAYTAVMFGAVIGGPIMGWLSDRFGIAVPVAIGATMLASGLALASQAATMWQFTLAHGLLIGAGTSASFGPVIADTSLWFAKRRGVAVAICSSGSYLAGTTWPLIIQPLAQSVGWRHAYLGIAGFCLCAMLPLLLAMRRRLPHERPARSGAPASPGAAGAGAGNQLQLLLMLAGVACCIAMAMPQVHIVAYCSDLGYGAARGAEMLSLMFGTGIISRLSFGWVADRIGPAPALLVSSSLQAASLLAYLGTSGLTSLYLVTAMFGLVQGGIVPTYALIVREIYPASQAGSRVGLVLSSTLAGMAIGGWMSGAIFDATLSYRAAFLNGFAWNLLNMAIAAWLLFRLPRYRAAMFADATS
ncbi:MAG: MFS transporter [Alphaproteobacteria bacterium]|nr:MFS transporter [Alphaproteobacteria bacterium]